MRTLSALVFLGLHLSKFGTTHFRQSVNRLTHVNPNYVVPILWLNVSSKRRRLMAQIIESAMAFPNGTKLVRQKDIPGYLVSRILRNVEK